MVAHSYTFEVDATPAEAFRAIHPRHRPNADRSRRVMQHGDVRIEIVHPGDDLGLGLVRTCTFRVPRWLLSGGVGRSWETITEVVADRLVRYEAVGKPLWSRAEGCHTFEETGPGRTRVTFEETYDAFNPVVRALLEKPVHRFISKGNDRLVKAAIEQTVDHRRRRAAEQATGEQAPDPGAPAG
jgi:hypothetical protein